MLHPRASSFSSIVFIVCSYWGSLKFPRNLTITYLDESHARSSKSFVELVNVESLMSCRICGPSKRPSFTFVFGQQWKFLREEPIAGATRVQSFDRFLYYPYFMCKWSNKTFCVIKKGFITFIVPSTELFFLGQRVTVQCFSLVLLSHSHKNTEI